METKFLKELFEQLKLESEFDKMLVASSACEYIKEILNQGSCLVEDYIAEKDEDLDAEVYVNYDAVDEFVCGDRNGILYRRVTVLNLYSQELGETYSGHFGDIMENPHFGRYQFEEVLFKLVRENKMPDGVWFDDSKGEGNAVALPDEKWSEIIGKVLDAGGDFTRIC